MGLLLLVAREAALERLEAAEARELDTLCPTEERLSKPEVMEDPTEEAAESAALVMEEAAEAAELVMEEAAEAADPVTPPITPPTPDRVDEPTVVS